MVEREVNISKSMEGRDIALFVQLSGKFSSHVKITFGTKQTNCKSIMGVMAIGVSKGDSIILSVDGDDENVAIDALSIFLETSD